MLVIVPNYVSDEIYKRVDKQLEVVPELKWEREYIYSEILEYFNIHGHIPEFTIGKKG